MLILKSSKNVFSCLHTAPSGPPTFVRVQDVTLTTFQVAWSPPAREKQNGVIVSYFLCIREFGVLHACNDTRIVDGAQSQQLFAELNPDREYLVEIKAATSVGYGPSAFVQKMAGKSTRKVRHLFNEMFSR